MEALRNEGVAIALGLAVLYVVTHRQSRVHRQMAAAAPPSMFYYKHDGSLPTLNPALAMQNGPPTLPPKDGAAKGDWVDLGPPTPGNLQPTGGMGLGDDETAKAQHERMQNAWTNVKKNVTPTKVIDKIAENKLGVSDITDISKISENVKKLEQNFFGSVLDSMNLPQFRTANSESISKEFHPVSSVVQKVEQVRRGGGGFTGGSGSGLSFTPPKTPSTSFVASPIRMLAPPATPPPAQAVQDLHQAATNPVGYVAGYVNKFGISFP